MSKEPDETNSTNNNNNLINLNFKIVIFFHIFNPINNESTNNAPVVFSFHGGGGTATENMESWIYPPIF